METSFIRPIELDDLNKIVELENKCFNEPSAYTTRQFKYLIKNANSSCFAEVNNDMIRGFIIVLYKNGTRVAGIETLNVDPLYRGTGIGKKLLIASEKDMSQRSIKRIRLEVSLANLPAIKLYEKSGFRISSIIHNYYRYPYYGTNDAYRMIKDLVT